MYVYIYIYVYICVCTYAAMSIVSHFLSKLYIYVYMYVYIQIGSMHGFGGLSLRLHRSGSGSADEAGGFSGRMPEMHETP